MRNRPLSLALHWKFYPLFSCSVSHSHREAAALHCSALSSDIMFVGRIQIHALPLNLNLNRSPAPAPAPAVAVASSNAPNQASASPPNPNPNPNPTPTQFAVQYLVRTCHLSYDEAFKSSKYIHTLKSPDKPDGVLSFLREIGVSEADIKTAVSREARILFSHLEKTWRPNIAKLQELGLSMEHISGIIAANPYVFRTNFVPKIDFLMGILGSVDNFHFLLKMPGSWLFGRNLEKVLMPNLSFLMSQCSLSPRQLIQLMKSHPRLLSSNPDVLKVHVERVEKLGIACSSGAFIHALMRISYQNECTIDAKLNNLTSMGLSQEEVALVIRKQPTLLGFSEKQVGNKMEYLIKEAGCHKIDVVRNPSLLAYSLENRLIPRNIVRKLLMSKGIPVGNHKFACFIMPSEEKFVKKFVTPYEHVIPGLHRAYADACAGKIESVKQFKSITS